MLKTPRSFRRRFPGVFYVSPPPSPRSPPPHHKDERALFRLVKPSARGENSTSKIGKKCETRVFPHSINGPTISKQYGENGEILLYPQSILWQRRVWLGTERKLEEKGQKERPHWNLHSNRATGATVRVRLLDGCATAEPTKRAANSTRPTHPWQLQQA